jgi:hypothetical protein
MRKHTDPGTQHLIKTKSRVADFGEVFTPDWAVDEMLDLVNDESYRLDSRFLEPACGSGNFLVRILERKLQIVVQKYGNKSFESKNYALLAVMCVYGIELLHDNVTECRKYLLEVLASYYSPEPDEGLLSAVRSVLEINIVHGDALKMSTFDQKPITFAEWGYLGRGKFQRRDFQYDLLTQSTSFASVGTLFADLGRQNIFSPQLTYKPMTMDEIARSSECTNHD